MTYNLQIFCCQNATKSNWLCLIIIITYIVYHIFICSVTTSDLKLLSSVILKWAKCARHMHSHYATAIVITISIISHIMFECTILYVIEPIAAACCTCATYIYVYVNPDMHRWFCSHRPSADASIGARSLFNASH